MMLAIHRGALSSEFRVQAEAETLRRFQRQQEKEHERKARFDDVEADGSELWTAAAVFVSGSDIERLRFDIDRYDAATIVALQRNEEELLRARQEWNDLLTRAHVLPDGRRVFKSEDGQHVYDEHGKEVDASFVDPDEIADERPHWEQAKSVFDAVKELEVERQGLLEYQAKLDQAREQLDGGAITQDEFDRLRTELVDLMPPAVREQFPEIAVENDPAEQLQAASLGEELDLAHELIVPAYAPPAPAPA